MAAALLTEETAIERADPIHPSQFWKALLLAQAEAIEWAAQQSNCSAGWLESQAARLRKEAE